MSALRPEPVRTETALAERMVLGMRHLSPFGLAEPWLLRDCGDRHWALIARAMGQERAVFADALGRPVYAAFCATRLDLAPVRRTLLGETVEIGSNLCALTPVRLGSVHRLTAGGRELARLEMISTFVSHDGSGSNRRILRSAPLGRLELPQAGADLLELENNARSLARAARARSPVAAIHAEVPAPALDFNAVGLLYFPTFSRLAETAQPGRTALARREVVHLGNVDPGEAVSLHPAPCGLDVRRGDGEIIAHIRTRRHLAKVD